MGKRLDLSQLSEEECEQILKVIQKDFELRQKDKSRIEWVHVSDNKYNLSLHLGFNGSFGILFDDLYIW